MGDIGVRLPSGLQMSEIILGLFHWSFEARGRLGKPKIPLLHIESFGTR